MTPEPRPPIKVALTNDFELVVHGLEALLKPFSHQVLVVAAPLRGAPVARPVDLALFDTFGHPSLGFDEISRLKADPNVERIAVFTWQFDPKVVQWSLDMGVSGYLGKNLTASALVEAMLKICAGHNVVSEDPGTDHHGPPGRNWPGKQRGLSERESEVLTLIAEGLSNEHIAKYLYLSGNSIKTHIRNGYRKLGVTTRAQAVRAVIEQGMTRQPLASSSPPNTASGSSGSSGM